MKKKDFILICSCFLITTHSGLAADKLNVFKRGANKIMDLGENVPVVGGWIKSARNIIPGFSKDDEILEVQKEHLETSQSALVKMQNVAQDIMKVKRQVEEANSLRKQSISLFQDLKNAKYGKVAMGITEELLGIELNPSSYIPSLESTSDLKRDCSFSFYREKAMIRNIDSTMNRGTRLVGKDNNKGIQSTLLEVRKEAEKANKVLITINESDMKRIPIMEKQIQYLADENKSIEKTLADKRLSKDDPIKLENFKRNQATNNREIMQLQKDISKIRRRAYKITKYDQKEMDQLAADAFLNELNRDQLRQIQNRDNRIKKRA